MSHQYFCFNYFKFCLTPVFLHIYSWTCRLLHDVTCVISGVAAGSESIHDGLVLQIDVQHGGLVLQIAVPDVIEACTDADILVFVLPHQFMQEICSKLLGHVKSTAIGVSLMKVMADWVLCTVHLITLVTVSLVVQLFSVIHSPVNSHFYNNMLMSSYQYKLKAGDVKM